MENTKTDFIKITALVENHTKQPNLIAEHGLSLFIECDGENILFDTGPNDALLKNAKSLGINLENIDFVVLSHEHYDHTGGLEYITNKKVYTHSDIFIPKYEKRNGKYNYIGIPHPKEYYEKENKLGFAEVSKKVKVTKKIKLYAYSKVQEQPAFYLKYDKEYVLDPYAYELALAINSNHGLVIITGCSHPGILNLIETVTKDNGTENVYALLGGFHLIDKSPKEIQQVANGLDQYDIKIVGISHCTGNKLNKLLKKTHVFEFNVGDSLLI